MNPTKFVFNHTGVSDAANEIVIPPRPAAFALSEDTLYPGSDVPNGFTPDSSIVHRHTAQQRGIDRIKDRITSITPIYNDATATVLATMFGSDTPNRDEAVSWAYRCFKIDPVHTQSVLNGQSPPLALFQTHIYFFNVLVAFEWQPSEQNIVMMERAVQHAADFLFDVTNGWMTFGQVLLGGPDLMDCADIQVLASNRLMPRSWVGALHEPHKYIPIRMGRGLWQKNSRGSIPWDEPESYRTLIHEWAHYALELLDDYTQSISLDPSNGTNQQLIVPSISPPVESIMATLEGTSELTAKPDNHSSTGKTSEWEAIIQGFNGLTGRKPRFPRITSEPDDIESPMPLRELPHVAWVEITASTDQATSTAQGWIPELLLPQSSLPTLLTDHCWVYILKQPSTGDTPTDIIAQGTLDTTSEDGFQLFGAEAGDTIVLIGNDTAFHEHVQRATIAIDTTAAPRPDGRQVVSFQAWEDCTPAPFPIIDVVPHEVITNDEFDDRTAPVHVTVSHADGSTLQAQIHLYPADYVNSAGRSDIHWISLDPGQPTMAPVSLDGHVLVRLTDDQGHEKLFIATYSLGGGPSTGSPVGGTPITPGSAEGNLMVFFADHGQYPLGNLEHSSVRVITTRLPGGTARMVGQAEARSYAYTLCSNNPIPAAYMPTLSLFYDKRAELEDGEANIYRWNNDTWEQVPSYRPAGAWYVAIPLDETTAPTLIDLQLAEGTPRIERYRLFLVPRAAE